jgi:hypothetical protein
VLLAVPLAAVIGVLVRFAIRHYKGSDLYYADHPILKGPPKEEEAAS